MKMKANSKEFWVLDDVGESVSDDFSAAGKSIHARFRIEGHQDVGTAMQY
ncbi:MAG: hypothetical protein LAO06_14880 [Acidobacteriia bacterium]|nr:hypothetical protein [Terriglobia bacterium]